MATIKVTFDDESTRKRMKLLKKGLIASVRDTLNAKAMHAGVMQQKVIPDVFTVRNKWVEGSLWPKLGKRKGLIPERATDIGSMYSTAGSISPLLKKQQEGFFKNDPSVPTKNARVGSSNKRTVRKKMRTKNIHTNPMLIPDKSMKRVKNPRERASALLAMAKEIKWRGLMLMENDDVLPAGYWSLRGSKLRLIRRNQEGRKRRKSIPWHEIAIKNAQASKNDQIIFNKEASKNLRRL